MYVCKIIQLSNEATFWPEPSSTSLLCVLACLSLFSSHIVISTKISRTDLFDHFASDISQSHPFFC